MKFIDINREFTAAANSYMAQGYYINAGTMGGSQGEVAHQASWHERPGIQDRPPASHLCIFDRGRERKYRRLKTEKLRYLAIRAFGGYDNETLQILRYHRGACR